MNDIGRFRPKPVGIFRLTADGDGEKRATVKRIMESDDFGFVRAMAGHGVMARQLESRLVSFRSGVHKHDAIGKSRIHQLPPESQGRFVGKNVAGMPQLFTLLMQCRHQRRMAMTERGHGNPTGEINVLFTLLIPYPASLTLHRNKFCRCINRQNDLIECSAGDCRLFSCHVVPILYVMQQ